MAESSVRAELDAAGEPAAGDLQEEPLYPDALVALGRVMDQLNSGGPEAVSVVDLSWALGVAAGTIQRLTEENRLLQATLQRHLANAVR